MEGGNQDSTSSSDSLGDVVEEAAKLNIAKGSCFQTEAELNQALNDYAQRVGFMFVRVKTKVNKSLEGKLLGLSLRCDKYGEYRSHRKLEGPPRTKKTNCAAQVNWSYNKKSNLYVITKCELEHNHPLGVRFKQRRLNSDGEAAAARVRKASFTESAAKPLAKDAFNDFGKTLLSTSADSVGSSDSKVIDRKDDAGVLLQFMIETARAAAAICSVVVDNESNVRRSFFMMRNGIPKIEVTGQLIIHTVLRNSPFKLPLILFTGLDHNNQHILFAFCLFAVEDSDSYVWALERLHQALGDSIWSNIDTMYTDGDNIFASAVTSSTTFSVVRNPVTLARELSLTLGSRLQGDIPLFQSRFIEAANSFSKTDFDMRFQLLLQQFPFIADFIMEKVFPLRTQFALAWVKERATFGFNALEHTKILSGFLEKDLTAAKLIHVLKVGTIPVESCASIPRSLLNDYDRITMAPHILAFKLRAERAVTPYATNMLVAQFELSLFSRCLFDAKRANVCNVVCDRTNSVFRVYYYENCVAVCDCGMPHIWRLPCSHVLAANRALLGSGKEFVPNQISARWSQAQFEKKEAELSVPAPASSLAAQLALTLPLVAPHFSSVSAASSLSNPSSMLLSSSFNPRNISDRPDMSFPSS